MSSVFALRQKGTAGQEAALGRLVTVGVIILGAAAIVFLGFRFVVTPLTTIRHVVVQGNTSGSDADLLRQAGLDGELHYFSLDTASAERRFEANPLVSKARVTKTFPNRLAITVSLREPSALVLASVGGRSVPVLVDRDGVIFKIGKTSDEADLPVVSGINVGEVALGYTLPAVYTAVFADLASLRSASAQLYRLISEVHVVSPGGSSNQVPGGEESRQTSSAPAPSDFELLLYLVSSPVRVRAAGHVDEALLKSSLMVLDLLSNKGLSRDIEELDLRSGNAVYSVKGG